MQTNKKVAFLIYPMFCNWEIALTLAILEMYKKEVIVFAADKSLVTCEEGMKIMPDKTLDEFQEDEYDCILLSGIGGNPDAVIYDKIYIDFLTQFAGKGDVIVAAISLAPVLLAQAGLLKGKQFCVGMYEEDREELSFFEYENQQRAPIVIDGNIITAMGKAFREFSIAIAEKLGCQCPKGLWGEIKYPVNPEDYIFKFNP